MRNSGVGLLYGYRIFFGDAPVVLLTNDYGNSWTRQLFPPTNDLLLSEAVILNQYEMNVTGGELFSGSVVLHTSTGGWTFINNNGVNSSDKQFDLFQNYPNPFNPNTIIHYRLSDLYQVELKVYDAAGNEVATLVNDKKGAGYYSVEFFGNNLASGVYFYKIIMNTNGSGVSFSDTKKMFLVK